MQEKNVFLRWALFACLLVIGSFVAVTLGATRYFADDPTHLTTLTVVVFAVATLWCGRIAWHVSNGADMDRLEELRHDTGHGWFIAELCFGVGLIGTAIGLVLMYTHVGDSATTEVNKMIAAGAKVSVVNTAVGAICGLLLQLQTHIIESTIIQTVRRANRARRAVRRRHRQATAAVAVPAPLPPPPSVPWVPPAAASAPVVATAGPPAASEPHVEVAVEAPHEDDERGGES